MSKYNILLQDNYFIKIKNGMISENFVGFINSLVFPLIDWTVGPKSLLKDELIQVHEENLVEE